MGFNCGSSTSKGQGPRYNTVRAYHCSDDSIEFRLTYEDDDDGRIRFIEEDGEKKVDELVFTLVGTPALVQMASMASGALGYMLQRADSMKRQKRHEDAQPNALDDPATVKRKTRGSRSSSQRDSRS